jgi:hypothetical protein
MRALLTALALCFFAAFSADAQQKTTKEELTTDGKWFFSQVNGHQVYDPHGRRLNAYVRDVLFEKNTIHSYVIGRGGFLGVGEIDCIVPEHLVSLGKDIATISMSEAELRALPHVYRYK